MLILSFGDQLKIKAHAQFEPKNQPVELLPLLIEKRVNAVVIAVVVVRVEVAAVDGGQVA